MPCQSRPEPNSGCRKDSLDAVLLPSGLRPTARPLLASPTCAGVVRWKRPADLNVRRARRDLLQQSLERCCHEVLGLASVGAQADPCRDRVHRAEVVERPFVCISGENERGNGRSTASEIGRVRNCRSKNEPTTLPGGAAAGAGRLDARLPGTSLPMSIPQSRNDRSVSPVL